MPRSRRRRRGQQDPLTEDERMELLFGPVGGSVFGSLLVARAAWLQCRDALMSELAPGGRPWGWWKFEARERPGEEEGQLEALVRLGAATVEEKLLFARTYALLFDRTPAALAELFEFQPGMRAIYERQRALIQAFEREAREVEP